MFQPVIKWTGSKRSQCKEILTYFPHDIETYHEPFVGSGAILRALLNSTIRCDRYICSDINQGLIDLWTFIMKQPDKLAEHYSLLHGGLKRMKNIQDKKMLYEQVRVRYNTLGHPGDFLFLLRTCANGLVRYNSKGAFNTSFHLTRDGIQPDKMKSIILQWSDLLNRRNVHFKCCRYHEIQVSSNDFIYMDPPYAGTKGMYYGRLDTEHFFSWVHSLPCCWAMSYDGRNGLYNSVPH